MISEPTSDRALAARWARDIRAGFSTGRFGAVQMPDPERVATAGANLIARWREPHRQYHDVVHLVAVLDRVDALAVEADDIEVVRLAAWFHDAVYQGRPGDDEEDS